MMRFTICEGYSLSFNKACKIALLCSGKGVLRFFVLIYKNF
jgi:hypothetical protein